MEILDNIFNYKNGIKISGLTFELNVQYILWLKKKFANVLVLTSSLYEANRYLEFLTTYNSDVCIFPMDEFLTSMTISISPDLKFKRLETLKKIKSNSNNIVVTNLTGFLKFLPNVHGSQFDELNIYSGQKISRQDLIEKIADLGFNLIDIVTSSGDYAFRGNIIDVFPINENHPIRIELFDNEIDSIRYFDENTQRSINVINNIVIGPINEKTDAIPSSLIEYFNNLIVVYINYQQLQIANKKLEQEILEYNESKNVSEYPMFRLGDVTIDASVQLNSLDDNNFDCSYLSSSITNFNSNYELLQKYLSKKQKENKYTIICSNKQSYINFLDEKLSCTVITNIKELKKNYINLINEPLNSGFEIDEFVFISQYDIEKKDSTNIKYTNPLKTGKRIKDFSEISKGDYVVHPSHGIGIYNGVVTLSKNGLKKDYLLINYKGNDKVYIPVEKINSIFKYQVAEGTKPRIDILNSTNWQRTKAMMKHRVKEITEELIKLYSARKAIKGPIFNKVEEEELFDSEFKYTLTNDQQRAIDDINNDLSSFTPMDRLLCGDVGFGKTEVAFRAMFKTVYNGYQVLYLCPTTILARQQYLNAKERFKDFPIDIALLNRFTSSKDSKKICYGLQNGTVDIIFGTHRLLSDDISFKRLGLLVVDEEQRFGVSHKEKLKKYKNDVNVLTLSATPIPRTLKMAMSGLRDLSLIDTPPVNRYPVQTYVIEYNDLLLKDSIYKELSRNGQIYVLYNKTDSIESMVDKVQRLVPEARIAFAHGKMNKSQLESVMQSFIDYKFDILICTTIIETGIDIANVNTLIVLEAENFGLSQLYQLRGRVGRSNRIAYAYLFFKPDKIISDIATKRLEAIKEFTELGSGYRIAMRDLALRGAGNILGSEQAGFIDSVGLDMYLKMLDEELNGSDGSIDDSASLIDVETHISNEYVSDESVKIEIHQLINNISDEHSLIKIKEEIEDRFGKVDESLIIYMYEEWFEKLAKKLSIDRVFQTKESIKVEIPQNISNKIKGDKLFIKAYNICPRIKLSYVNKKVNIELRFSQLKKHFLIYLVPLLEEIINEIE